MSRAIFGKAILFSLLLMPLTSAQNLSANNTSKADEHLRIFKQHLAAFNAGDLEELKKFAAEHLSAQETNGVSPEEMARREAGFSRQIGKFELYEVEKNNDTEIVSLLKTGDVFPFFVRAAWHFDASNPALVINRDLSPVDTPTKALEKGISVSQLAQTVDNKLTKLTNEDKFAGAVLIAQNGKPLWQKAYGYADRDTKTPNNVDTRFRLGSMNKMITSVAIAQLVQAGKIKYTDTLAKVLPDYPNQQVAQKITVHHLLTHTSGLGDIFGPEFDQKKDSLHEIKDYLQLFADKPLAFEPGARWDYSNAGFIVLGLIIERVSGQNYYDYVQQHIYDVAGMKSSGSFPKTQKIQNLAVGYTRTEPGAPLKANWDTLPWRGMSAGGGDSNLGDLLRFAEALRSHKLLNAELTETIVTGKIQNSPDPTRKYAYGFEEHFVAGHRVVGHSGGAPGMNSQLNILLDNGYTVVVLANLDPPAAQRVANYITERLGDK